MIRSDDVVSLSRTNEIDRLIAICAQFGLAGRATLFRAVRNRQISVIEVSRDAKPPIAASTPQTRPAVCLIGDDDHCSTGPTGWVSTPGLLAWAQGGLVHASGGSAESYALAVRLALRSKRFLLIETSSDRASEWSAILAQNRIRHIVLKPETGGHPVLPSRGSMQ